MDRLTDEEGQRRENEPERIAVAEDHVGCPTREPRAVAHRQVEHLEKIDRVAGVVRAAEITRRGEGRERENAESEEQKKG